MKRSAYLSLLAAASMSLLMSMGCRKLEARDQIAKGVQAYKDQHFEEAINRFQRAEQLDPSLVTAPLFLASAYQQQVVPNSATPDNLKNAQLAIGAYQQVLDKNPQDLGAARGIAAVYFAINKFDDAKRWQQKVLAIDPKDPVAHYTIGVIDWTMAYKNAITMRNSLNLQDNGDPIKDKSACQKLKSENTDYVNEGIQNLQQAIDLRPTYEDAMTYLTLMYVRKADLDCGDEDARKRDMDLFHQWGDKTMATRKANEEKKNEQTPKGVIMDGK
jgi:tetratricopeptide (TPR) repeat protein